MPYNYTWVPKIKRPDASSRISVKSWDGKTVHNPNISVTEGKINITVPEANRYKITVFTGPIVESTTVAIPNTGPRPSLNDRVLDIEQTLTDGGWTGETSNISLTPDPDNEGFFILDIQDPTA